MSSSSVYGVSDAPEVTEEHPLVPLTLYNKYKGMCEPLLFKHQSPDFVCVTIRPATVCGYSPRMRFDLTINILTNHAVNRGIITVFGGTQKRPNIHVDDVTELYVKLLEYPDKLDRRGDLQRRLRELHGGAAGAGSLRPSSSRNSRRRRRSRSRRRPRTISAPTTSPPGRSSRSSAGSRGARSRTRSADLCQAFKDGKFKDSMADESFVNVKVIKKLGLK